MNKGFSLIEIIVYVSLLSLLMLGVFASVTAFVFDSMKRPTISSEDYELLIQNYHERY